MSQTRPLEESPTMTDTERDFIVSMAANIVRRAGGVEPLAKRRRSGATFEDDLSMEVANLTQAVRTLTLAVLGSGNTSARLLKPKEVAALCGISDSRVYDLIKSGDLPSTTLGEDGTVRVPLVALQAIIFQQLGRQKAVDTSTVMSLFTGDSGLVARLLKGE